MTYDLNYGMPGSISFIGFISYERGEDGKYEITPTIRARTVRYSVNFASAEPCHLRPELRNGLVRIRGEGPVTEWLPYSLMTAAGVPVIVAWWTRPERERDFIPAIEGIAPSLHSVALLSQVA